MQNIYKPGTCAMNRAQGKKLLYSFVPTVPNIVFHKTTRKCTRYGGQQISDLRKWNSGGSYEFVLCVTMDINKATCICMCIKTYIQAPTNIYPHTPCVVCIWTYQKYLNQHFQQGNNLM